MNQSVKFRFKYLTHNRWHIEAVRVRPNHLLELVPILVARSSDEKRTRTLFSDQMKSIDGQLLQMTWAAMKRFPQKVRR